MRRFLTFGSILAATLMTGASVAADLDSEAQKLGYIIGMDIGQSLKQQGAEIDLETLFEAIEDIYMDRELAMTPEEAANLREAYIASRKAAADSGREEMAAKNAAEGDRFLLENRLKEGVAVTDSGLQYTVLVPGTGAKPKPSDRVRVHYRGTLLNGEEFDSSYARGEPITFALDQVIPGWTEGVQLMQVGSKYKFYIPSSLAYGSAGGGPIGPNATLIFDVELLGIEGG